jgi:hypothetical protein
LLEDEYLDIDLIAFGHFLVMKVNDVPLFPTVDYMMWNGVAHPIKRVLLPPGLRKWDRKRHINVEE